MATTVGEIFSQVVLTLSPTERLRLATLILNDLVREKESVVDFSDTWTEQDRLDLTAFSLQHAVTLFSESNDYRNY